MDFATFAALKPQLLSENPDLLDCTETRLARVLAGSLPNPASLDCPQVGYRCHVAEWWLDCFGLPAEWKPQTLVSRGVRSSLSALFGFWAKQGSRVAIPGDVYPVYLQLAQEAGCPFSTYASYPSADFNTLAAFDVVLVTDPFKPRGSPLTPQELTGLLSWLADKPSRRVVVDAVYQFDTQLTMATRALLATGQALVLHSLAKGWASPLLAGVALVPPQDVAALTIAFRSLEVDRQKLALAQGMLVADRHRPRILSKQLQKFAETRMAELSRQGLVLGATTFSAVPGKYLLVVPRPWEELLDKHRVLALPFSTFGSERQDHCVLSTLPPLRS